MSFQSTVEGNQGYGVVGDIVISGPRRGRSGILSSTDAANNVIGRAVRFVAGSDTDITADAAGNFAGILANSKAYASFGSATDTLGPTLTLPNETNAEYLSMTSGMLCPVSTAANIGDNVFYANATGILAAAAGTTLTDHTLIPNARIVERNIPAAGNAVIELTGAK